MVQTSSQFLKLTMSVYSERNQSNTAKALKTKLTLESHIQKVDGDCKLTLTDCLLT